MSKSSRTPSPSSSSKSLNRKRKPLSNRVKFKHTTALKPNQSVRLSKHSRIEAEIDQFPFDFKNMFKSRRSQMISDSSDDRYSVKGRRERSVKNIRITDISDDEIYVMADIFDYQQLPNMSDFTEGFSGFFLTALAVTLLISFSFMVVFSIDAISDGFVVIKKTIF
ncbi:uncharacterized protein LOC124420511 [Lucilia cuprina]|uniref:uncharacterized protein LOC124420511 n=1 Tax=Lucilia cuprina TaxID=7375 RepID=UPI001F05C4B1|nr:uncharacterized protein LOC124420511 [Lucilia cuprina]XP_046809478.1 uncharacterized protein LOC124420511 [Lucilia cuprina]XP_046809480.1 uncharacterized protein LOC124420511 [Lucilia cuprina]